MMAGKKKEERRRRRRRKRSGQTCSSGGKLNPGLMDFRGHRLYHGCIVETLDTLFCLLQKKICLFSFLLLSLRSD
jgi:hypothetical protein